MCTIDFTIFINAERLNVIDFNLKRSIRCSY